ncbi:hypothetical protein [Mesorhizobium sp. M4A.F.Ca.ET.050.02.1.1]|uniref:hypothetical protein n=1 Tax=Mesorhizobium sp. M4A.F.Ca.ET.050.02.1.1 TaxID=2496754 RepID=UPI001FE0F435|nr:hypothetical protein [Mesorhizobium sp. M4A.F.Ca.ET.050.02.1.1]
MKLTAAEMKKFGRLDDAQPVVADFLDGFKTIELVLRQRDQGMAAPQYARSTPAL